MIDFQGLERIALPFRGAGCTQPAGCEMPVSAINISARGANVKPARRGFDEISCFMSADQVRIV